jgi:hypothetical protein
MMAACIAFAGAGGDSPRPSDDVITNFEDRTLEEGLAAVPEDRAKWIDIAQGDLHTCEAVIVRVIARDGNAVAKTVEHGLSHFAHRPFGQLWPSPVAPARP